MLGGTLHGTSTTLMSCSAKKSRSSCDSACAALLGSGTTKTMSASWAFACPRPQDDNAADRRPRGKGQADRRTGGWVAGRVGGRAGVGGSGYR